MSVDITIVVQSFGKQSEYLRTIFSVWSFYAHVHPDRGEIGTLVYTDAPDFFNDHFEGLPVTYITLTAEWMREMRGEHNFLHRMKIAIMDDAFRRTSGNLAYVDGDTFFTTDPSRLLEKVAGDLCFMHTREYDFRSLLDMPLPSGAPFQAVVRYIQEQEFTMSNGHKRRFDSDLFSWNAGVIMLHRRCRLWLPDVFAITDQLYAGTRNHASEQYAFSLVLQTNSRIESCEGIIYHYWYRIKKQIADDFLARKMNSTWKTLTVHERMTKVREWTRDLPEHFENHVLTARDHAVQAFNSGEFARGYRWTFKAMLRDPFDTRFLRDVAYHTRRLLSRAPAADGSIKVGFCIAYDWPLLAYSLPLIYDEADLICLSVDVDHRSWAQRPFDWDESAFNALIRLIDVSGKIQVYRDNFHLDHLTPAENEVRQRKMMSDHMGAGGWHIQLDCDEYFLDFGGFVAFLRKMRPRSYDFNVCCQWITLFKQVKDGFLYVYPERARYFEFMQIASRTPAYEHGRRNGHFNIFSPFLIVHQSWARSEKEILDKLSNWGHVGDFNVTRYFDFWKGASEKNYKEVRDFHPVRPESWPSLKFQESDGISDLISRFRQKDFPTYTWAARSLRNSMFVSKFHYGIRSLFKRLSRGRLS